MVKEFKEKTKQCFQELLGYNAEDIEQYVLSAIEESILGTDIKIKDIALYGSRSRGMEGADSDIDVVIEYESQSVREDTFFNWLHELDLNIEGIPIDINPIREQETGTMEEYLKNAERYMDEKLKGKEGKNMLTIREFRDENGKVLCGGDICEYHASVKEAMKGFYTFENFIGFLNRCFEEENTWAVRTPKSITKENQREYDELTYDMHVAESHINDNDIQEFIKKHPDKLTDPLGNYKLSEVAEVYYAVANNVSAENISFMIEHGVASENMRVIRKGYENGIGNDVALYADLEDAELQSSLLAGLVQKIDRSCVEMIKKAYSSVTVYIIWNGMKKGLSKENASFLLDMEQRIVKEKEAYFDALNDAEIETSLDMMTLLNVCMERGPKETEELVKAYVDGVKEHVGMEYTLKDVMNKKKTGKTL